MLSTYRNIKSRAQGRTRRQARNKTLQKKYQSTSDLTNLQEHYNDNPLRTFASMDHLDSETTIRSALKKTNSLDDIDTNLSSIPKSVKFSRETVGGSQSSSSESDAATGTEWTDIQLMSQSRDVQPYDNVQCSQENRQIELSEDFILAGTLHKDSENMQPTVISKDEVVHDTSTIPELHDRGGLNPLLTDISSTANVRRSTVITTENSDTLNRTVDLKDKKIKKPWYSVLIRRKKKTTTNNDNTIDYNEINNRNVESFSAVSEEPLQPYSPLEPNKAKIQKNNESDSEAIVTVSSVTYDKNVDTTSIIASEEAKECLIDSAASTIPLASMIPPASKTVSRENKIPETNTSNDPLFDEMYFANKDYINETHKEIIKHPNEVNRKKVKRGAKLTKTKVTKSKVAKPKDNESKKLANATTEPDSLNNNEPIQVSVLSEKKDTTSTKDGKYEANKNTSVSALIRKFTSSEDLTNLNRDEFVFVDIPLNDENDVVNRGDSPTENISDMNRLKTPRKTWKRVLGKKTPAHIEAQSEKAITSHKLTSAISCPSLLDDNIYQGRIPDETEGQRVTSTPESKRKRWGKVQAPNVKNLISMWQNAMDKNKHIKPTSNPLYESNNDTRTTLDIAFSSDCVAQNSEGSPENDHNTEKTSKKQGRRKEVNSALPPSECDYPNPELTLIQIMSSTLQKQQKSRPDSIGSVAFSNGKL